MVHSSHHCKHQTSLPPLSEFHKSDEPVNELTTIFVNFCSSSPWSASPGKLSTSTHSAKKHPGAWMHKLQLDATWPRFQFKLGARKKFKFIEMDNGKRIHVILQYLCILCFSSQMVYERCPKSSRSKAPTIWTICEYYYSHPSLHPAPY
jgi:hypothetical protein